MLTFIFFLGCSEQSIKDDTENNSIFRTWRCYERDGLAYPYTYEGNETQEIVDHDVTKVWQDIQLIINENYTGELISFIDVTENDGAVESFTYALPLLL